MLTGRQEEDESVNGRRFSRGVYGWVWISSPVAEALAGLRANEARYYMNKYRHAFTVTAAGESQDTLDYVNRILKEERDIEFAAKPLETSRFQVENIKMGLRLL